MQHLSFIVPMTSAPPAEFSVFADRLMPWVEAALAARVEPADGCPPRLREAMAYALLAPGKRIRPLLALLAAEACGGPAELAMPAACAVEMVHCYSLIHDDLPAMDDDDLRRGRPTCHRVYGEALAILAGDALLAMAFETLACEIQPPARAAECCRLLATAAGPRQLVGGQADDIEPPTEITREQLESVHQRKTGAMIEVSLRLGAICTGTAEFNAERLAEFGRKLGLAFQIVDDLLDAQGDAAVMGKRAQKDADRGKRTFPAVLGLDVSAELARKLTLEAHQALEPFGQRADGLHALADFVLGRNR